MTAQGKRIKLIQALAFVENNIHEANLSLRVEEEDKPEFDVTYKAGRDAAAKGKLKNIIELYLNQESTYPEELAKAVKDGDDIHITVLLAGG